MPRSMEPSKLTELSNKIENLIDLCQRLQRENQRLRSDELLWQQERVELLEINEVARTRVEAMIGHLKALEPEE